MSLLLKSIYTFYRGFGFFALVLSVLGGLLLSKWNYILLGIYLFGEFVLNVLLKKISKAIMGNKTFPIIGKGTRPNNAKSCGFFTPRTKIKKLMKSFGMPSGHSQTFAFLATLIGLHLYNNNDEDEYKTYKYIALVVLTLSAMYMRVYIENCHTVQQTIVGSIIGVLSAIIITKLYDNPFSINQKPLKA